MGKHRFLQYEAYETGSPSNQKSRRSGSTHPLPMVSDTDVPPVLFAGIREVERFVREQNEDGEGWQWDYRTWSPDTERIFRDLGWLSDENQGELALKWVPFSHTHEEAGVRCWWNGWAPGTMGWNPDQLVSLQLVLAGPTKRRRYWVGQHLAFNDLIWTVE